ncbi:MAG TPA: MgtC/SapB family protein [Steroidobacteraceae bacterium]|nr:MgtC/SapB family protein [Steroidobacteraceae bacterium]
MPQRLSDWSLPEEASAILVALGAGLLIGIERERRMEADASPGSAGVRTFTLTALLGVLVALSGSDILLGGAALGLVALTALSYHRSRDGDPGLTSEIALLATFVVGVIAAVQPVLAAAAGVLIAVLLVLRAPLHAFARGELSDQEMRDAVLLAGAAILVLPILPDHPIDPWNLVNPRLVWKLTVLIMLVDAAGYVAQRLVGARAGLPISGLLGGFVSSTVVVATMGRRAQEDPKVLPAAVAGAALSQIATVVQLALVLAVSNAALLASLGPVLLVMGAAMAVYGVAMIRATRGSAAPSPPSGRAFRLRTALLFAGAFVLVMLLVAWLQRSFGTAWALAGVVAGGFADAHSTSASIGSLAAQQQLSPELAAIAIGLVVTTNTISKLGFARAGGAAYFWRLAPGLLLLIASFWIGWWLL